MKPNKQVLESLQRYDRHLYLKWNNVDHFWEVWRKMPWGSRFITGVTQSIYEEGGAISFAPLDNRIVEWIYSADSVRKDLPMAWKYRKRIAVRVNEKNKWKKFTDSCSRRAKDMYYLVNNDLINLKATHQYTGWKAPEIQSKSTKRTMFRKEYYDYNSNS